MHRLEAVARVGERPRHDHAHGVIEVGALHFVEDGYGTNIGRSRRLSGVRIFRVRQRGIRQFFVMASYSASGALKPPLTDHRARFFPSFFQRLTRSARLPPRPTHPAPATRATCPTP